MKRMDLATFLKVCRSRSPVEDPETLRVVDRILDDVRLRGDAAVLAWSERFDGVRPDPLEVTSDRMAAAVQQMPADVAQALHTAATHIREFAVRQRDLIRDAMFELRAGVRAGWHVVPVDRVGIYVPGGRYPLPSTVLMTAIPARVAGVREIVLCSPPSVQGDVHPAVLAAAHVAGVDRVFRIGGVQAIAAMAFGTESVPRVDMIVGPGNRYVVAAKQRVYGHVGIDLPAGPTELMVIADETAPVRWVAADLIAQAEHDTDAVPVVVATSASWLTALQVEIERQLADLPTAPTARTALERHGIQVLVHTLEDAAVCANAMAPEHLEVMVADPNRLVPQLRHYGTLFIGPLSATAFGDYSSGLNHTLPTGGCARFRGGLSVLDFLKVQTVLEVMPQGLTVLADPAVRLAELEGLIGHARSIRCRNTAVL